MIKEANTVGEWVRNGETGPGRGLTGDRAVWGGNASLAAASGKELGKSRSGKLVGLGVHRDMEG